MLCFENIYQNNLSVAYNPNYTRITSLAYMSIKIRSCMSFGPCSDSSFIASLLFLKVYWCISERVRGNAPCLTLMLLKKYFNWYLACSYNCATLLYALMAFPWGQMSSIITLSATKWLIIECFDLKPAWPNAHLWWCLAHELIFCFMIVVNNLAIS